MVKRIRLDPYADLVNDPDKKGTLAAPKIRFGEFGHYAIAPVRTRFCGLQWFVWNTHIDDRGLPAVIRQEASVVDALAGFTYDDLPPMLRKLLTDCDTDCKGNSGNVRQYFRPVQRAECVRS